jgi:Leucine-rich repeat (LRR) protein
MPLRSALRNANGSTPVSAMKKRAAWHSDLTPAREREPSAAPSSGSNRRSVSFSDGYIIAQHIEAERAEWSRVDGKGRFERYECTDIMEESSIAPSMRTRRIQNALDDMADLQITDIDDDEDESPDPSPSKPARSSSSSSSSSSAVQKRASATADASEGHSDSTVPITAFRSFRSFRRGGADQTFLTECSFGVAHDRLVQLITDVQPFEPHWENLRTIDLTDKGVESLARLKEFLPRLDEANLNDNQIDYLSGVPNSVRTLRVAGNRLTSLTSVNHLRNLHFLDISRNQIDSVSQLDCLIHLRELVIDNNQVSDLSGIMGIDCLVKLSVAGNAIEELDLTHAKWESLETLDLSRNKIRSIRGLERLKSLTTLKLDANALVTLEPASPMNNLRILRVSDNGLMSLDVSLFPRLRTLFADNNALPGITRSGAGGHRIENLSVRNQGVAVFSLTPEDIQAAKRLYVSGNAMSPDFLSTPVYSLVYLEAIACQLSSWPTNLATHAPNLRVINVNYNFIETLDDLAGLTRLRKLMAVGCRLGARGNAVRGLQGLDGLEELDLRMNPATLSFYLPILLPAKKDKSKKETESRGTAINDPSWAGRDAQYRHQLPDEWYSRRLFYRGLVFGKCPDLRVLDGLGVTSGEKTKAAALLAHANGVVG